MDYCSRGCGEEAAYITKKGVFLCHRNAAKCACINPKGKPKTKREKAIEYIGDELCEFCNIHKATHTLVNGKLCCSSTAGNCKETRRLAGISISKSRNLINQKTGLTNAQEIAIKVAKIKEADIDENGLNAHQRNGKIVAKIKEADIDENGLNAHQRNGKKYSTWYSNLPQEIKDKKSEYHRNMMNTNGEAKRRAKKMVETKLNNIDENGLNGFDRSHLKSKNVGYVDGIFYQSNNEKRFLENIKNLGLLHKIKRGTAIRYNLNGKEHIYLPDYIIDNNLYEVKQKYTWLGKNNCLLETNIIKLTAAAAAGFKCFVVIDDRIQEFNDNLIFESRQM